MYFCLFSFFSFCIFAFLYFCISYFFIVVHVCSMQIERRSLRKQPRLESWHKLSKHNWKQNPKLSKQNSKPPKQNSELSKQNQKLSRQNLKLSKQIESSQSKTQSSKNKNQSPQNAIKAKLKALKKAKLTSEEENGYWRASWQHSFCNLDKKGQRINVEQQ